MKNGQLKNGEKMVIVRIEHFVKLRDFAVALTDHYYNESLDFNLKLTKKEAEKILKRGLFFYGLQGQYDDGYFEATFEEGERYNQIFEASTKWIKTKYDWFANEEL